MTAVMRRLASAAIAAALLLGSASAFADPTPQDISQARDLGQQAQAAHEAGNFAESERLWTAASNLYPAAPTLTLGLARAQVKQGKYVLARETYNKIIREQSNNPNASAAFKDALAAAQSEMEAASAKIARVTVSIEGGAPNAQVTIDNEAINAAGIGVPRPIDPGQHTVKASAEGYVPAETTFQVAEAGSAEAKLTLAKDPNAKPATVAGPGPTTAPGTTVTTTKRDHTMAIIALGVGGAGLVFGGVTGILAMGKHSDLDKACPDGKCTPTLQSDVDSYHTMATLSTIGFIVGGVGVAAGAVLWFVGPKKEVQASGSSFRTVEWHPYFAGNGGGVAGRF